MDGVPAVLGATSDMPFVGSRTRSRQEQVQGESAAEVSISRLFDGSSGDHHVSRGRGSHDMDIRRDREEGQKHGGAGMVGGNSQGGRSGDEWDGVVIPSMGETRAKRIGGSSGQFNGFVDILTVAQVRREVRLNKPRMN
jgi:hypothetical protein